MKIIYTGYVVATMEIRLSSVFQEKLVCFLVFFGLLNKGMGTGV